MTKVFFMQCDNKERLPATNGETQRLATERFITVGYEVSKNP